MIYSMSVSVTLDNLNRLLDCVGYTSLYISKKIYLPNKKLRDVISDLTRIGVPIGDYLRLSDVNSVIDNIHVPSIHIICDEGHVNTQDLFVRSMSVSDTNYVNHVTIHINSTYEYRVRAISMI